jgi:hypothetical protein
MLSKAHEFAKTYIPGYGVPAGMLSGPQGEKAGSMLEAGGQGLSSALRGFGTGGRQAFNKLTGDQEELARLGQEEEAYREQYGQQTKDYPTSAMVGRLAGNVGVPMAAAAALPTAGLAAGAGLGVRTLAGALGGGAAGYTQPLTQQEEQAGQREVSGGIGAAVGGLAPGVGKIATKVGADDAIKKFAGKYLRANQAKGSAGAYKGVSEAVESKHGALRDQYLKVRNAAEEFKGVPVILKSSSRLDDDVINLSEEVSRGLSPTAKRVALAAQKGATKTSQILDESGKPIQDYGKATLKEVRETIRELKAAQRAQPYNDAGIQQSLRLEAIANRLDDDLKRWAEGSDEAAAAYQQVKAADEFYAKEVAPMSTTSKEPIGKYRKGAMDEQAFDTGFLKPNKGQAMTDLLRRVPEAKDSARELYGHKLIAPSGPLPKRRLLEGGPVGEALFKPKEREYMRQVADAIREAQEGGPITQAVLNTVRQMPVAGKKLDAIMRGVPKAEQPSILSEMLRSYGAGRIASTEED